MPRLLIITLFAVAIAAFFLFDLGQYLTLDALKAQQAAIAEGYATNPLLVIALFFLLNTSAV